MREILFRGKTVDRGEWVFGYYTELPEGNIGTTLMAGTDELLCEDTSDYIVSIETKQCPSFSPAYPIQVFDADLCKVRPETVGQYTGLTDRNGTRIFEGDILNCQLFDRDKARKSYEVVYEDKLAMFLIKDHNTQALIPNRLMPCCVDIEVEVIGNIYDNPELLEVEQ